MSSPKPPYLTITPIFKAVHNFSPCIFPSFFILPFPLVLPRFVSTLPPCPPWGAELSAALLPRLLNDFPHIHNIFYHFLKPSNFHAFFVLLKLVFSDVSPLGLSCVLYYSVTVILGFLEGGCKQKNNIIVIIIIVLIFIINNNNSCESVLHFSSCTNRFYTTFILLHIFMFHSLGLQTVSVSLLHTNSNRFFTLLAQPKLFP